MSENLWFSDVFRGYGDGTLTWKRLIEYGKHESVNKEITNKSSSSMEFSEITPKYFFALGKHPRWVFFFSTGAELPMMSPQCSWNYSGQYLIREIVYLKIIQTYLSHSRPLIHLYAPRNYKKLRFSDFFFWGGIKMEQLPGMG